MTKLFPSRGTPNHPADGSGRPKSVPPLTDTPFRRADVPLCVAPRDTPCLRTGRVDRRVAVRLAVSSLATTGPAPRAWSCRATPGLPTRRQWSAGVAQASGPLARCARQRVSTWATVCPNFFFFFFSQTYIPAMWCFPPGNVWQNSIFLNIFSIFC